MLANKKFLIIFFIVVFVNIIGCSKEKVNVESVVKTKDELNIVEVEGIKTDSDTLKVLSHGVKGVFNPLFAISEGDKMASSMMFMPFIGLNSRMEYDLENSLVKRMSIVGNVISFQLRDDISWWDKVPVTTADIVFSLEKLLSSQYFGYARRTELFFIKGAKDYYQGKADFISGIEIIDAYKMKITFENFQDSFYYALNFRPIAKHYYENKDYLDIVSLSNKPMGNGAYQLSSYEKDNFIFLKANENFIYDVKTPYFMIRDIDNEYATRELSRGNLDIATIYGMDDFVDEDKVLDQFIKIDSVLNKTYIIRISNSNSLKNDEIRKRLLKSINLSKLNDIKIKSSDSIISLVNKAFVPMDYSDLELIDNEKKFFTISLIIEKAPGIKEIADVVKKNLSDYGFVVNQINETSYSVLKTARRLIKTGRNVVVLSEFNHGYRPDFLNQFSTIGDGNEFFFDVDELDEAIFDALNEKNSGFKNGYAMLLSEYKNRFLARGVGSPIVRHYFRKEIKNIIFSEFLNWYEFDIWNIGVENDFKKTEQ